MPHNNGLAIEITGRLLNGRDYTLEIESLVRPQMIRYTNQLFTRIVSSKLHDEPITAEWYRSELLKASLLAQLQVGNPVGDNEITNVYPDNQHERGISETVADLAEAAKDLQINSDIELDVNVKVNRHNVTVDLNAVETLIFLNCLAFKFLDLRGGAWDTACKKVESTLMLTLCKLYGVSESNYDMTYLTSEQRKVDFYLISRNQNRYQCEVKLMGKGNPESADATIARNTHIFVADKLSDLNKQQLTGRGVEWVELRGEPGYRKFGDILNNLDVPYTEFSGDLDARLDSIFQEIFS